MTRLLLAAGVLMAPVCWALGQMVPPEEVQRRQRVLAQLDASLSAAKSDQERVNLLRDALAAEPTAYVRDEMLNRAEKMPDDLLAPLLEDRLKGEPDCLVRGRVATLLGGRGSAESAGPLISGAYFDRKTWGAIGCIRIEETARRQAMFALAELAGRHPKVTQRITQALRDLPVKDDPADNESLYDVRLQALYQITREPELLHPFFKRLKSHDSRERERGVVAFRFLKLRQAPAELVERLKDQDREVSSWTALVLGEIGDPKAAEALMAAAGDPKGDVGTRANAIMSLGLMRAQAAVPLLECLTKVTEGNIGFHAARALGLIKEASSQPATLPVRVSDNSPQSRSASQPADDAQAGRLALLVENLGADDFKIRDAAQKDLLAIGLPALPVLKRAMADKDPERASRAGAIVQEIIESAFQARLGKVTIRLLGVSERPTSPNRWWLPNGEPLEKPPAGWPDNPGGSEHERVFGIAVQGLDHDARVVVLIEPTGGGHTATESRSAEGMRGFYGRSPAVGVDRVVVDVGIEQGPWERFGEGAPGETTKDAGGGEMTVSRLEQENEALQVTCTYQTAPGWWYRPMLITTDGSVIGSSGDSIYIAGGKARRTVAFRGVQPEAVARIRLERRAVEWVRFDNVSVVRGRLTEFAPARRIPAEQAGRVPLPAGLAPVGAASRSKDEAEAATVAERFLAALHAGESETAEALSLGSVVGWVSRERLQKSRAWVLVGLMDGGVARVGEEIRKEIKFPGGKPQAGQPATEGDIIGVPFQVERQMQYLLVLLKRTEQGWRVVTLGDAKGTVAGETAEQAEAVRKALARLADSHPATQPATQTRAAQAVESSAEFRRKEKADVTTTADQR